MYDVLVSLSLWESLFNFYSFYSTFYASKKMQILPPAHIMLRFLAFALPFLLVLVAQIHFEHHLFPLVIALDSLFNAACVWLFGHILIVQCRFVMGALYTSVACL